MELEFIEKLAKPASTKIVLLVLDGLGGLTSEIDQLTELETALTPNLDKLAKRSTCGLHQPIAPGITPGSGPAHLALFGYDPIKYKVGRGVLSALGVDFDLTQNDVAARGNFCTLDEDGKVSDRRAGRISTEKNQKLCASLSEIQLPNIELIVQTVKEHRFLLVMRGEGLSGEVADTDPQAIGQKPLKPKPRTPDAQKTADLINEFIHQASAKLADAHPANMVLMRGFSKRPNWLTMSQAFQLKAAAIAAYPMYRGVAKLIGMDVLDTGSTIEEEFDTLEKNWADYDFFYLHVKPTDSAGEDGDFDRKIKIIEDVDKMLPRLLDLVPDVLAVTGDHSTPALMGTHSWHPVPVMLWSKSCLPDNVDHFGERACMNGGLGPAFPAKDLMPLMLANALRLDKYGA